jgi:hypothetical protein
LFTLFETLATQVARDLSESQRKASSRPWAGLSGRVATMRGRARRADERRDLALDIARLQGAIALDCAAAWRGTKGDSFSTRFADGLRTGRAIGAGVGGAAGAAAGAPAVAGIAEAVGGLLGGLVSAVIPFEAEALRARLFETARSWDPIERYLSPPLLRQVMIAARRRENKPIPQPLRFDDGGFKIIGPLYQVAGHFSVEALFQSAWPELPPTWEDDRTLYAIAIACSCEDDALRIDDLGLSPPLWAPQRAAIGAWYYAALGPAGRPTCGQVRARAASRGIDFSRPPVGPWAAPLVQAALARRSYE